MNRLLRQFVSAATIGSAGVLGVTSASAQQAMDATDNTGQEQSAAQEPGIDAEGPVFDVAEPWQLDEDFVEENPGLDSPAEVTGQDWGEVRGEYGEEPKLEPSETPLPNTYGEYGLPPDPETDQGLTGEYGPDGPLVGQEDYYDEGVTAGEQQEDDFAQQGTGEEEWMAPAPVYEDEQLTEDIQQPIPAE